MDLFSRFTTNDPVAAVDPADLRSIWAMQHRAANPSGQPTATDIRLFEHVCSPGADVQSVLYRAWMLRSLAGMLLPWVRDGVLADAVFKVGAIFPMKKMSEGAPQQGLPFDVQGFFEEIEKQIKE